MLDRGGMGVLYKATDLDLDRTVALKIIAPEHTQNPTAVARFKAEARLAASLEHPNIVPIHRGGEYERRPLPRDALRAGHQPARVIDRGQMDLTRVARIIGGDRRRARSCARRGPRPPRRQAGATSSSAARASTSTPTSTDFGLTKRLGSARDLTRAGAWVGTPDYVAPEQIQGHTVDRRADVYSLGCVLYEMLTGHVAYPKDSDMAKLWAHVTDPPPMPSADRPELVQAFDDVVARATAKDPDERYATAGELAEALQAAVREQSAHQAHEAAQPTHASDRALSATRGDLTEAEPGLAGGLAGAGAAGAAASPATSADTPPPPQTPAPPATDAPAAPLPVPVAAAAGGGAGGTPATPLPPESRGRALGMRIALIGVLLAAAGIVVAVVVLGSSDSSGDKAKADSAPPKAPGLPVNAELAPVPTNHVDGVGDAKVRLNGQDVTVTVNTTGLLNNVHAMHIHAGTKGVCPPGRAAKDHGGHLSISTLDGVPWYGPPVTALTTRGDTSKSSILAFKRFPSGSDVRYKRTIRVSKVVAAQIRTHNAVLIVHGIDWNRNGIYDNAALNRSDLNRSLPGEITAPALCGELVPQKQGSSTADGNQTGQAGSGEEFAVAFTREPDSPAWLCHIPGAVAGDRKSSA